jgi:hypothetical protein
MARAQTSAALPDALCCPSGAWRDPYSAIRRILNADRSRPRDRCDGSSDPKRRSSRKALAGPIRRARDTGYTFLPGVSHETVHDDGSHGSRGGKEGIARRARQRLPRRGKIGLVVIKRRDRSCGGQSFIGLPGIFNFFPPAVHESNRRWIA